MSSIKPPNLFLHFFRWFCDPSIAEDIEGDLLEMFYRDVSSKGLFKARLKFSFNTIRLFRPGIIRKINGPSYHNPSPMFKNYFITSVRSLMRNKSFSMINIVGLAIGLATFTLISLYVYYELSFDRYHQNADRIFRIVENLRTENELLLQSTSSPPMGPNLLKDFPEVESYVRLQRWTLLGQRNGMSYYEPDCYLADSTIFDIFSFNLIKGDKKSALREPNSIVLTESTAKKYFGDEDPIGQMLQMDYEHYKVTGVMVDVPENSHFTFSALISFSTWSQHNKQGEISGWYWNSFHTFLLLRDKGDINKVRAKMKDFIVRNIEKGGMYYEDLPLQPLTSIYMAPERSWENGKRGSMTNIYILSFTAIFILLIACFNYVNLATARASRRLKEVGLRKSLGALRRMLITQFLGESIIIVLSSSLIAGLIAWTSLPAFNVLVESQLSFSSLPNPEMAIGISLIIVLFIGILAGAYPAFVISRFQPTNIFRPSMNGLNNQHNFRKLLVTIQFSIAIMLVAGTLLVRDQMELIRSQDLGFQKDNMILVPTNGDTLITKNLEAIKNELKVVKGVDAVTSSNTVPGQSTSNQYTRIEMADGQLSPTNINYTFVDHDFLETYDIDLIAGRNFLREVKTDDTTAYLINETAVRNFGWSPEQALGKAVQRGRKGKIIGVVKDFHYRSLHTNVEPLLLALTTNVGRISIRLNKETDARETISALQAKWSQLLPHLPFDYTFLDVDFDRQYKADQQLGKVANIFTVLSIFIGCLGLLGLTSFVVERRTKEIGIRKVLGASAPGVVILIAREFMPLIMISLILATPVTWYLIVQWEQNFALQAAINPGRFLMAGLYVFIFALITISYLSFRAATANPVKALRTE